jgi:hypothetical protein
MTAVWPSASNRNYPIHEATMVYSFGIPPLLERSAIQRSFVLGNWQAHRTDTRGRLPETFNPRI